jgi:hypothetical protein
VPNKKVKYTNSIKIQNNKLVFLGCPCSTLSDGTCKNYCHKITSDSRPCIDCPSSAQVYIAIAILKELENNELLIRNLHETLVLLIK